MSLSSRLLSSAAYPLAIWAWSFGLIGLASACLTKESKTVRYLADSSYWLYLIHLPVVMVLQVLFANLGWPWFVKFPLMLAAATALMLASYQLAVRNTFIGAVLNGKRVPRRPWRVAHSPSQFTSADGAKPAPPRLGSSS